VKNSAASIVAGILADPVKYAGLPLMWAELWRRRKHEMREDARQTVTKASLA
jgi:hypothetical protein